MATFEPPLDSFFGTGATQDLDTVTFTKSELKSETTPPQFLSLVPKIDNSAESIFIALLQRAYEKQNLANDSQVRIIPSSIQLVNIISDGVEKVAEQSMFTVAFLRVLPVSFPNPNDF
jgi:hypothetical protein